MKKGGGYKKKKKRDKIISAGCERGIFFSIWEKKEVFLKKKILDVP